MKSKQTLKVGDLVKVINNTDSFYNKVGTIIGESFHFDWIVKFTIEKGGEVTASYDNYELQLLPKKEVKKWKYSRVEWLESHKYLDLPQGAMVDLLAKQSIPKKKSKEIKEIEPLETRFIQVDGIQPEQTQNNEYFASKINELTDTINLLIKIK